MLVEARSLFREALRTVMESEPDLRIVAEAADANEAVATAERVRPDVAFVEVNLPGTDGIDVVRRIRDRVPHCRALLLADEEETGLLLRAIEAGASGFLTKDCPLARFIDSTRAIHRGEVVIPPRMLGGLLSHLIHRRREQDVAMRVLSRLTPREREVLGLLAHGATNDAIARRLVISPETARTHVHNLLGKLDVHSRLQAAAFVLQNGLLEHLAGAEP